MPTLPLFCLGTALAAACATSSGDAMPGTKIFPYAVETTRLENGLHVSAVPTPHRGIVAFYTVVRTGSRNEVEPGKSGFAHFFEHMMFRGTKRHPEEVYNRALKELGADSNAFTTDDWTCYHAVASSEAIETLFDLESDRFRNLEYEEAAFQKEARSVLGEYNKSASSPFTILHEKIREAAFSAHTYRHTTIGFLDDIREMPNQFEYSRIFFDRWYRPENCWLVVLGDVEAGRVFDLARRYYGDWSKPAVAPVEIAPEPPQTEEKSVEVEWPTETLPILHLGWRTPAYDPSSKYVLALDALSELVLSESSPLYRRLVLDDQSVDLLFGGSEDHRDPYLFTVYARVKDEGRLSEVETAIEEAFAEAAETPPTAERLAEVQSHLRFAFLRRLDSPDEVASALGHFLQLTGDPDAVDRAYATLAALEPEDVRRAAAAVFVRTARTRVVLRAKGDSQ